MAQFLGIVTITADGVKLESFPGAKIDLGGYENKATPTSTGVGFVQELKPSTVECDIAISKTTDLKTINNMTDVTLAITTDIGQNYVIRNAFRTDTRQFTGGEGKGPLKFAGPPAEEI